MECISWLEKIEERKQPQTETFNKAEDTTMVVNDCEQGSIKS